MRSRPKMELQAKWIIPSGSIGESAPVYRRRFTCDHIRHAVLRITALGVYRAELNGKRVGDFFLAPGFTAYRDRLQVQEYDVTGLISAYNEFTITVGKGWYHSRFLLAWEVPEWRKCLMERPLAAIAELEILDESGQKILVSTDESWEWALSPVRENSLYDGEVYDATWVPHYRPVFVYPEQAGECFDPDGRSFRWRRGRTSPCSARGPSTTSQAAAGRAM